MHGLETLTASKSLSAPVEDSNFFAHCLACGKSMVLNRANQKFCSDACNVSFQLKISKFRRLKRNEYQKSFRKVRYKTEVKHLMKVECPKCNQFGYLVRYIVRNRESRSIVSVYETVRHQITKDGHSILRGQCYVRSVPLVNIGVSDRILETAIELVARSSTSN